MLDSLNLRSNPYITLHNLRSNPYITLQAERRLEPMKTVRSSHRLPCQATRWLRTVRAHHL